MITNKTAIANAYISEKILLVCYGVSENFLNKYNNTLPEEKM